MKKLSLASSFLHLKIDYFDRLTTFVDKSNQGMIHCYQDKSMIHCNKVHSLYMHLVVFFY